MMESLAEQYSEEHENVDAVKKYFVWIDGEYNGKVKYSYLISNGIYGNNLPQGSEFTFSVQPGIGFKQITNVKKSIGGRGSLSSRKYVSKARSLLLSRNRIVTVEDIRALCFDIFDEDKISKIEIVKKVLTDAYSSGLREKLHVDIFLKKNHCIELEEIDYNHRLIESKLEKDGIMNFPVIVKVH